VSASERRARREAAPVEQRARPADAGPDPARPAAAGAGGVRPADAGADLARPADAGADLARRIAALVDDKKGEEIVALDVRELVDYTDYLVIATARNERQAKAIYDEVHLRLKKDLGLLPARTEGEREARWLLVDYLDCVLHVFVPEMRDRYRLERLWGEAARLALGVAGGARE
jgi:ribosome-associated protein